MRVLKSVTALLLTAVLVISTAPAPARAADNLDAVIKDVADVLQKTVTSPGVAQTGGDWTVFALARSGVDVPGEYKSLYYNNARDYIIKRDGVLSTTKNSEYSRVALAVAALGSDPSGISGYDMIKPLTDFDATTAQGINGPIFALLALAAAWVPEPQSCEKYVDYILAKRLPDGGFAMSGEVSDPDTTALAITALSAYSEREDVSKAIESGIERLSRMQRDTGGYTSYGVVTSESVSQVIVALSTLGISADDARFVKNGIAALDNLMLYYIPGEGFEHELGRGVDLMATEQALCALAAVRRARDGQPALYDLSDVTKMPVISTQDGLPGKHSDVNVPGVTVPDAVFEDIAGAPEEAAILALARRGIVNGYPGGGFASDKTLTRAEFAAIVVRALGLKTEDNAADFSDVAPSAWYYNAVSAAAHYGIVQGRGDGMFDPDGTLTRQEAAVMIARAAKLCGMDTEYNEAAARGVLSQFTDYRQIAEWATGAMAFCYDNNLLDQDDITSRPNDKILRSEMATLTYRMLVAARLIERGELA